MKIKVEVDLNGSIKELSYKDLIELRKFVNDVASKREISRINLLNLLNEKK